MFGFGSTHLLAADHQIARWMVTSRRIEATALTHRTMHSPVAAGTAVIRVPRIDLLLVVIDGKRVSEVEVRIEHPHLGHLADRKLVTVAVRGSRRRRGAS
jgi:hypothetical protein